MLKKTCILEKKIAFNKKVADMLLDKQVFGMNDDKMRQCLLKITNLATPKNGVVDITKAVPAVDPFKDIPECQISALEPDTGRRWIIPGLSVGDPGDERVRQSGGAWKKQLESIKKRKANEWPNLHTLLDKVAKEKDPTKRDKLAKDAADAALI